MVGSMLKEKSYRTKESKFPTAKLSFEQNDNLLIAVWSWGAADGGPKALDIIKDYYLSARTDIEATSPFPLNPDLSLSANHLRIGVMLANDIIAKENNNEEYTTGIEVICMSKNKKEVSFVHVGGPSLISLRENQSPVTYIQQSQLGNEFDFKVTSPLPRELLGIKPRQNVICKSIRTLEKERFLLVQRNYMPQLTQENNTLEKIEAELIRDNKDLPFWICEFTF